MSATYQAGWASVAGKKNSAHNVLLWQACQILRKEGIKDLDLGGVNEEGAAGVKVFKEGMGGELVQYVGQYC
jgi:lipid II:glycine glycyltransferase (peptidoglycan interpeptide bridge formation enzyme)